jgi:hypothetical protein
VTRSIDKIEIEHLTGSACVWEQHGLAFDGNASLPFNIHVIKDLVAKLPVINQAGVLNQTVGQGGFAMIDVGNNAEISNLLHGQFDFSPQRNAQWKL